MKDTVTKPLPISAYATFKNFLLTYQQGAPSRIDSSVLKNMGGTVRLQLLNTLKFFELIDDSGKTSPELQQLVKLGNSEREKSLNELFKKSYPFIFADAGFDLAGTATSKELSEKFEATGLSGSTLRKGIAFFLNACVDANIPLSKFISLPQKRSGSKPTMKSNGQSKKGAPTPKPPTPKPSRKPQNQGAMTSFDAIRNLLAISEAASGWSKDEKTTVATIAKQVVEKLV